MALGDRLFHDHRLSESGTIACATCHDLARRGIDGHRRSFGAGGRLAARNAPTVFNAALGASQFWDGRAATLEDQIDFPLADRNEMDTTWPAAIARLAADPVYRAEFAALYPDGLTPSAVKDAIATFERTLLTPGAPFDRFLLGDRDALSPAARDGLALFGALGCAACHDGPLLGGRRFARFQQRAPRPADPGEAWAPDTGRHRATGREEDRFVFRVPPLRNVAVTPPYFHDGSALTLPEAVRRMAADGGHAPSAADVDALVAFLESLTGEFPRRNR
ncbi:MAG: cytochrome-c peroxidase [Rhodospirillaceae bacterium]